ncbi:DNA-binding MarR family transcriptional regulator [Natranaerovirga pectinivora]|uniref:DNA-binding MarR family transcriptional regulator n=1 Tax=Natranaerovirga pectinivora TaxID=682400 RepID=A0A4R3ML74_9FIRM|nr:MarR family transcriptional regulator [Natranaerovirga pectinivora]TCT15368.1 DNA-binding MarR family transcriptional regulator [Natranaerovirga pectinivora]
MDNYDALKLDNQLCFAIYAASKEITKVYTPYLKELGLTYTQYITMLVIWEHEKISVKELGIKLLLDSGTLTPLLKKLEKMHLVTKQRDVTDERSVIITLTEYGLRLKDKAVDIPYKLFCRTELSIEEINYLKSTLYNLISKKKEESI